MGKFYKSIREQLSAYVKHYAWLNTAPKVDGAKGQPVTRLERMEKDGVQPQMPEIDAGEHLIGYLWDAGTFMHGALGLVPLNHSELEAWQKNSGVILQPWETKIIRSLSADYIRSKTAAESPNCPPPFSPNIEPEKRKVVATRVKSILRD